MDEPPRYPLAIPLIEVVATEVTINRPLHQHVVDHDQDGVGDSDGGLRPTAPGCQASVLRRQVRSLGAGRRVGGLNQAGPQPGASLARRTTPALASTLVVAGTEAGPGGQVLSGREAGGNWTDLGNECLGHRWSDAGDGIQPRDRVCLGAQALGNLGTDTCNRLVEE